MVSVKKVLGGLRGALGALCLLTGERANRAITLG